jgi:hypothetical protein
MKYRLLVIAVLMSMIACKNEPSSTSESTSTEIKDFSKKIIPVKDLKMPQGCTLVSLDWVKKNISSDTFNIESKIAAGSTGSIGCFYRWPTASKPNAGFMINVMVNPYEEETQTWASSMIGAFKTGMNGTPAENSSENYKVFEGYGDEGAYSFAQGRYYWRIGNNYVIMVAFNMDLTEEIQLGYAKLISTEVMKNFYTAIQ